MKNILLVVFSLVSLFSIGTSESLQARNKQREAILNFDNPQIKRQTNINSDWLFILGDNPEYRMPELNDKKWRNLDLPHDWSIEGKYTPDFETGKNNGFFPEGIGWYRKHFTVSKDLKNKQFVIQFNGVFMNSEVWINGRYLGRRPFGYATFRYDLTDNIKFGEDNVIAVRVDNSQPGADRWYHGSGIYRDVFMLVTNYVHFYHADGLYITTPLAEKKHATVHVQYKIMGSYFTDQEIKTYSKNRYLKEERRLFSEPIAHDCVLRSIIYDATGKEISRKEDHRSIKNYDLKYIAEQELEVNNPHRWSDTDPYLYTLKSELEYNGKILDELTTKFGIRKLEFIPQKGLFVNGKETKLKGVCIHHCAGALGAAVPKKALAYRLSKLKEMGCNSIRTSHNPFDPSFYEICDSIGLYVYAECFDEWTSGWKRNVTENPTGKALNSYFHYFKQWAETDLTDMIQLNRNHPSIIMYGIGNEIPDYALYNDAYKNARKLVSICHREDPTRPVGLGNNNCVITDMNGVADEMDIHGYNYVKRYHGKAMYSPEFRRDPNKLYFGSETDKDIDYFLAYRDNHYVIGQYIWTGIDYLGEVREKPYRGWNRSLLDMTLHLESYGALFNCLWSDIPKAHIMVSEKYEAGQYNCAFNWNKWEQNQNVDVVVFSNCDEVELFLNGKSLGRKKNDFMTYTTEFSVKYLPGKLEAVCYNNGVQVVKDELTTAGKAMALRAKVVTPKKDGIALEKNGKDIAIIQVEVVDRDGNVLPDGAFDVEADIDGPARVIAMDSPNLKYAGMMKTNHRETMNGHLMVTIQSVKDSGDESINLVLKSKGLKSANLEF